MRTLLPLAALLAAAAPAAADGALDFVTNPAQSNFTWSGTTSLGPIVGDPSNAFQIDGHQELVLSPGMAGAKWTGQLTAGDLLVVPDLKGKIPNPLPFLPPLATIQVNGLRLSLSSGPFDVLPDGSFTAVATATALAGTLVVTPLTGSQTITDLSGSSSSPAAQSGTLLPAGGGLHWAVPIDVTFDFSDPGSGVSGSLSTQGTVNADWSPPAPATYCTAKTSSSGCVPALSSSGTPSASATGGFTIDALQLEANKGGIFFFGTSGTTTLPFHGGLLCAQPPLTRTQLQLSGGSGACTGALHLDFNAWLVANKPELRVPGQTFYVQCWFRDPADPVSGSGVSDALTFVLAP